MKFKSNQNELQGIIALSSILDSCDALLHRRPITDTETQKHRKNLYRLYLTEAQNCLMNVKLNMVPHHVSTWILSDVIWPSSLWLWGYLLTYMAVYVSDQMHQKL